MNAKQQYPTEPVKIWGKAKELRQKYYRNYIEPPEKEALRYNGGTWNIDAVPRGLSVPVYSLTGEPYGASCSNDIKFTTRCMQKTESYGFARDLCAYFRNYTGSVLLGEYAFGGSLPKADFIWQSVICCTHAKWYEAISEMEGDIPMYFTDISVGPCPPFAELSPYRIDYIAGQLLDGIEWLEKTTGKDFDDEKFIQAAKYYMNSMYKWAKVCELNQTVPAPLGEKSMFSLYVLGTLERGRKEVSDFYDEVYEEAKDRVARGIAEIGNEQCRLMTDSQPPWSFLEMWRYFEHAYGAISVGSLYTYALTGSWDVKEGKLVAKEPLDPGNTRESACRALAEWHICMPIYAGLYHAEHKNRLMCMIARQWKIKGVILHLNRGCEGSAMGIFENRIALTNEGFPCLTFEGNMGDEREVDKGEAYKKIDIFMEDMLGVRKIA